MFNKKANQQLVSIVAVVVVSVILGLIFLDFIGLFKDKATDSTNQLTDKTNLGNYFGIDLETGTTEIRYNAISELDQEFREYLDLMLSQMFNSTYIRYSKQGDPYYSNKDKHLIYYDTFPVDKRYSIQLIDDGIGLKVYVRTELNNVYQYATYENLPFLKNKHVAIIAGNPNEWTVETAGIPEFAMIWTLKDYCGSKVNIIGDTEEHFLEYQSIYGTYNRITEGIKHFYPLSLIGISPSNNKINEEFVPELYWFKHDKNINSVSDLEYRRMISINGHLLLRLDSTENQILANELKTKLPNTNVEESEFFVFFPSIEKLGDEDKEFILSLDQYNPLFNVEGIGFPNVESVSYLIRWLDFCR
ncbi:MAG: hypothetical protein PHU51_00225 [Candidatus Nanoarchaeia archaeon]|nr:hypothetical protein [Candidatus Nanoarchaeia archaeon]